MSLSLTNDLIATKLDAQNNYILDPLRLSSLTAVVAAYRLGIFTIDANLLHTYTTDKAHSHTAYPSQNHFSPFVSIGMKTDNFEMSITCPYLCDQPQSNNISFPRFGIFFLFEKENACKRKANSGLRPETPRTPRRST